MILNDRERLSFCSPFLWQELRKETLYLKNIMKQGVKLSYLIEISLKYLDINKPSLTSAFSKQQICGCVLIKPCSMDKLRIRQLYLT